MNDSIPYLDGLPLNTQKDEADALNQNFEYCNELAERLNLVAKALNNLAKRVELLEKSK